MGRRNKSRFERWFSLGQQKMHAGAKKLSDQEALRVEYFITNYDSYVNDNEAKLDGDN
jgi:hypothetical protein|tara:strand:+ start:498 stop:671 length:174 start_codon:yes stop_codon:yes gene_type:complete